MSLVPSHTPSSVSLVKPRLPTIACAGETPENSHHSSSPAAPVSNVRTLPQIDNQTWVENSSAASQNSTIDSEHPASILTPQPQDRSETQEEEEEQVDAMGAGNPKGSKNYASDSGTHGYFGASSAMSFMRELQEVISKRAPALSPENFPSNSSLFNSSIPSNQNANRSRGRLSLTGMSLDCGRSSYPGILHDFVLPPRKVADGLVWSYWTLVHTLYPFLHKESFMKTYSKLWEDSNDVENMDEDTATIHSGSARGSIQTGANEYPYKEKEEHEYESENDLLFQCILNLVFALGCQLSPEISESERELASDVFFQRSKKLLHIDILDVGNLKVIQALLLMGQYLQCTKMPKRCWIVVGLATRVAQGLGLHLETGIDQHNHSRASDNCGQLNRELRRRLWGGCIVLDRYILICFCAWI